MMMVVRDNLKGQLGCAHLLFQGLAVVWDILEKQLEHEYLLYVYRCLNSCVEWITYRMQKAAEILLHGLMHGDFPLLFL